MGFRSLDKRKYSRPVGVAAANLKHFRGEEEESAVNCDFPSRLRGETTKQGFN